MMCRWCFVKTPARDRAQKKTPASAPVLKKKTPVPALAPAKIKKKFLYISIYFIILLKNINC